MGALKLTQPPQLSDAQLGLLLSSMHATPPRPPTWLLDTAQVLARLRQRLPAKQLPVFWPRVEKELLRAWKDRVTVADRTGQEQHLVPFRNGWVVVRRSKRSTDWLAVTYLTLRQAEESFRVGELVRLFQQPAPAAPRGSP